MISALEIQMYLAPEAVNQAIKDILDTEDTLMVHGYMSNVGYEDVRRTIAESINQRFETNFNKDNLIMTVGCASGRMSFLRHF